MTRLIKPIAKTIAQALLVFAIAFGVSFIYAEAEYAWFMSSVGSNVVKMQGEEQGVGTGFTVRTSQGKNYILSNQHVCAHLSVPAIVIDTAGKKHVTKVLAISRTYDLCLLEATPSAIGIPLSRSLYLGQQLYLVGYAMDEPITVVSGFTTGASQQIIPIAKNVTAEECSGTGFEYQAGGMVMTPFGLMRQPSVCYFTYSVTDTTLRVFPGNSGSPVVNRYGELVGVAQMTNQVTNNGMAVPLKNIKKFIAEYEETLK